MEPKKAPRPPDDDVTQQLREAARRRRPWSLAALLLVLLVLFGPLAVFVWWTWPEGEPPRLAVVAADQLALPNEETVLQAYLDPIERVEGKPRLRGLTVEFEKQSAASQVDGSVAFPWQSPKAGMLEVVVRYPGTRKRRGAEDRARAFVRQARTPILLADIADALSPEPPAAWEKKIVLDIPPRPAASKALHEVAKRGYQVVYVAVAAPGPLTYRKYREWVLNLSGGAQPFPAGPVLGKYLFSMEESAAREKLLRDVKGRFQGPLVALVGTGGAAAVCRAVGVRTLLLGNDDAPKEVIRLPSLDKLAAQLTEGKKN